MLGRVVALVCLLAGCDRLFKLDDVTPRIDAGPDAAGPPCSVIDPFTSSSLDSRYLLTYPASGIPVHPVSGELSIEPFSSQGGYNGIQTKDGFNLDGGTAQVELVRTLNAGNTDTQFSLAPDFNVAEHYFLIYVGGGSYFGFRQKVDVNQDEVSGNGYKPPTDRFLRFRFEAGDVLFETSPTGEIDTWILRYRTPAMLPVTNLHAQLSAGTYDDAQNQAPVDPGVARFDNLKICAAGEH